MRILAIIALCCATPVGAADVAVPSGHVLRLFDVIMDPPMGRFRFVLPQIADGVGFDDMVADFDYLCAEVAQPALVAAKMAVDSIVISVSAAEVPFGETTDVVQYFQPYRLDGGNCIWEDF
ncbi:MAG: DUF6497 family protein [Yoonia sp.]